MKVFLIILAVLAVIIIAILSLSATLTIVYDKGWQTKIQVLFIEKEISLSKILSFVLFPEKKAQDAAQKRKNKKEETVAGEKAEQETAVEPASANDNGVNQQENAQTPTANAKPKSNPIKNLWDKEGIVGIMTMVSNLIETANSAVLTLIRGLHIYSLYVMILVGGPDADMIARSYGTVCKYYYPLKGMILNGMKVDNYDDYIQPDFIADKTVTEFQLIVGLNVGLLLKVVLKAGFIFLKNLIKNKKGDK